MLILFYSHWLKKKGNLQLHKADVTASNMIKFTEFLKRNSISAGVVFEFKTCD